MKTIHLVWLVVLFTLQVQICSAEDGTESKRNTLELTKSLMEESFIERISKEYQYTQDEKGFINVQMVLDGPDGEQVTASYVLYGQVFGLSFNVREKNGDLMQIGDIGLTGTVNIGEILQKDGINSKTFFRQCLDAEKNTVDEESSVGLTHGDYYQAKYEHYVKIFLKKIARARAFFKSSKFNPVTTG